MKEYEHDAWIRGRALLPRLCRTWFRTTWGDMLCWTCNLQLGLILRATGGQAAAQEMTLESRRWRLSFRVMPNLLVVLDCFTISRAPSLIINHVRPPDYDTLTTYQAWDRYAIDTRTTPAEWFYACHDTSCSALARGAALSSGPRSRDDVGLAPQLERLRAPIRSQILTTSSKRKLS